MFKKILCILSCLIVLPAFAGVFENAIANNEKVFLYMYTPTCGYCVKFNPIYNKLASKYSNKCKFLKLDLNTAYGMQLAQKFNVTSIPYVVTIDNNKKSTSRINPKCLMDYACTDSVVNKFVN